MIPCVAVVNSSFLSLLSVSHGDDALDTYDARINRL